MTFWSDRFRRDDEDDIWKELRQMLMNPPTEQELVQKKKQEQAWIDSILNKAFPEGVNEGASSRDYKLESKVKKEPYLTYEDLLDESDKTKGYPTGMASVMDNNPQNKVDISKFSSDVKKNIKDKIDLLTNQKVDHSSPMTLKDSVLDFAVQNPITRLLYPASSDIYTDGMTNFSRAQNNPNAKILNNMSSLDRESKRQLKNYGVNEKHKGVYYNADSNISKLLSNSPEIQTFINSNKDAIKSGKITQYPFEFKANKKDMLLNRKKFDRKNSIQHGKLWDIKINDDNTYSAKAGDLVDYSQRKVNTFSDFMNNHGYNMQEKGNFQNYYTLFELKSRLEEEEKKRKKGF